MLLLLLSFCAMHFAAGAPLVLTEEMRRASLEGFLGVALDASVSKDIDAMAQARFEPIAGNLSLGYYDGAAWLRFELTRTKGAASSWWLEVRPAALDYVSLFTVDDDGGWRSVYLGDNTGWAGRAINHRTSVFVLDPPVDGTQVYYLRVYSSSNTAAALMLWQPAAFIEDAARSSAILGGFLLTTLIVVVVNAAQGILMRERLYLYYSAYALAIGGFLFLVEGMFHLLVLPKAPLRMEWMVSLLHAALIALLAKLFCEIVQLRSLWPRVDRLYRALVTVAACVGVVAVPLQFDALVKPWLWGVVLGQLIFQLLTALWFTARGHRQSRFYVLAFGALLVGSSYTLLTLFGVVPAHQWGNLVAVMGSLLHMALMQLSVNEQTYQAKCALDDARELALESARRASQGLEHAVAERTRELDSARAHLEHALDEERSIKLDQQRFLRMVAHEFRTPLAVISTAADVIELEGGRDTKLRLANLTRLRRAAARLAELVDHALAEDRFQSAAWRTNAEWVSLGTLVEDARRFGETIAAGDRKFLVSADDGQIQGGRDLLRILLHNLVDNAVKHTVLAGEIEIRAFSEGRKVRLQVCDDGSGIEPDELPFLFDKYQRGRNAQAPGLGLGLYLVDNIARLHGGRVDVKARQRAGVCFEVVIDACGSAPDARGEDCGRAC
ncbi:sensor histidine kinase [Parazoarcus communis]|uniref:sensor histidine kinase n=1 Tax=Parazoarcus communis TaxID=41977 RepID=UPI0014598041|nr:sensor histidine kinase [Parazoarcus communis]